MSISLEYGLKVLTIDKSIPFDIEPNQIFFIETKSNKRANHFFKRNYQLIKDTFKFTLKGYTTKGYLEITEQTLFYFPFYTDEILRYYAPHMTLQQRQKYLQNSFSLSDYIVDNIDIEPSLITLSRLKPKDENGNIRMVCVPFKISVLFKKKRLYKIQNTIEDYIKSVLKTKPHIIQKEETDDEESHLLFRMSDEANTHKAEDFDPETEKILYEVEERIRFLRDNGISTYFLHKLIDESASLSRLYITKNFRIFLPDYNNKEIVMDPLPKAVFILFLRHLEGIRFKNMIDYKDELYQIYFQIKPNIKKDKREQSIASLTDSLSNSLNEKCARVREAFIGEIAEEIARNYYITGRRGEPKRIILDESLIEWE